MKGTAAGFITAQDGKLFPNYRQMRSSRHPAEGVSWNVCLGGRAMKIQRALFMLTIVNLAVLMFQLTLPKPSVLHRTGSSFSTALKRWTFTSYCINHQS